MAANDDEILQVLKDIRAWIRAASHDQVRASLEKALPDAKSRQAYQMFDGNTSFDKIRSTCKLSPNSVVALSTKCVALGLMETRHDKKRVRVFDLATFGLLKPRVESGESDSDE